jgi:hypothetical protein
MSRLYFRLLLLVLALQLVGCAVLESPRSWGWGDPGKDTPSLAPNEIVLSGGKTAAALLREASSLDQFADAVEQIREGVAEQKTAVKAKLDEASGGNYGWGILGAGAAVANLHVSALKGIAMAGGAHVALSTRLSPKDQIGILSDTITRLGCVADVARANSAANKAVVKSNIALQSVANTAASEVGMTVEAFSANQIDVAGTTPDEISLADFKAAAQNVLFNASSRVDGLYTAALAVNSTATDLVTNANTLVTKLKANASAANAASANAEKTRADLKSQSVSDETANAVADAKKSVADAKKNADDTNATAVVRLAACQT